MTTAPQRLELEDILKELQAGTSSQEEVQRVLELLLSEKEQVLEGNGFSIDLSREKRTGFPEVIFAGSKTTAQLLAIITSMVVSGEEDFLLSHVSVDQYRAIKNNNRLAKKLKEANRNLRWVYHEMARVLHNEGYRERRLARLSSLALPAALGKVTVVTAGSSDEAVAEEAAVILSCLGAPVSRVSDVGVAGLHRLFRHLEEIRLARVVIVIAGMDGVLPGVIGGLVRCPVIAVPSSIGYGAHFGGLAPLLTMLNACAPGVAVVNIDNGLGAAALALKIIHPH